MKWLIIPLLLVWWSDHCWAGLCSTCECVTEKIVNCASLDLKKAPFITAKEAADLNGEGSISFTGNGNMKMAGHQIHQYLLHFTFIELDGDSSLCQLLLKEGEMPTQVHGCTTTNLQEPGTPSSKAMDMAVVEEEVSNLKVSWMVNTGFEWTVYIVGCILGLCFGRKLVVSLQNWKTGIDENMNLRWRNARRAAVARNAERVQPPHQDPPAAAPHAEDPEVGGNDMCV